MSGGPTWLVLRSAFRRRVGTLLAVALTAALGAGSASAAFVAARRTDEAYTNFVRQNAISDVIVNPSLTTVEIGAAIRSLPGVTSVRTHSLLTATVSRTSAGPLIELIDVDSTLQVRGSVDGHYVDVDRPALTDGRMATGEREVFVSEDYRDALEVAVGRTLAVGDEIDMAFWWGGYENADVDPEEIVEPIGVETLRISGFGFLPDEVLPDELYPRQRLVVSSDIAARYGCTTQFRADMGPEEAYDAAYPHDCARSYDYYALALEPDAGGTSAVRDGFAEAADALTGQLPPFVQENAGFYYVAQERRAIDDSVDQTTRPTITMLVVFGAVAAGATLAILALAVARAMRRDDLRRRAWNALGATRRQSTRATAVPLALAAGVGLAGAALVAWLLSWVGPVGTVRSVDPSPGLAWEPGILVPVLAAFAVVALGTVWLLAARSARTTSLQLRAPAGRRLQRIVPRGRHPAVGVGVRAAVDPARVGENVAVLVGAVVAVAVGVAAVVFGTNLARVVDEPARYGWSWDVAVITGAGYGGVDVEHVDASLAGDPDIADHGFLGFDSSSRIADRPTTTLYGAVGDNVGFPVLGGRMPAAEGEVALGASTAGELGIVVGDVVDLASSLFDTIEVEVVGIVVLPSLGPFISDRAGLGRGAYLVMPAEAITADGVTMVSLQLRDGVDGESFLSSHLRTVNTWDVSGAPPYVRIDPVRPPEIVEITRLRSAPLILGGLLGAALVAGLALAIAVSVRDRRRELAVLRTLGFTGRELRATVRAQALSVIGVGIVAGGPIGIVAGHVGWTFFAEQLGVAADVRLAAWWLLTVALVALVVALGAAALPGWMASRISTAEILRNA